MQYLRLGVNIDHVATIRNARGGNHPDPVKAALLAEQAGADGITAHLREDRRHIGDDDIQALKEHLTIPLNLEMAATEDMLEIALNTMPNAACIVPEKRQEVTTEGGLDLIKSKERLLPFIAKLKGAGIRVSLFIEPDAEQVEAANALGADIVELHTGQYCISEGEEQIRLLGRLRAAATHANQLGLECHAGHGLCYETVSAIAEIPEIVELNIGHFLIGEAIFIGLTSAIGQMRILMDEARISG